MPRELSIMEAIMRFGEMAEELDRQEHAAMKRACKIVQREAKQEIGHYQSQAGPFAAWAPLAAATKADRVRQGYPADQPLLRAGDLRDSIEIAVSEEHEAAEGVVGSNDDVAVYQELGTSRIPPRSFLGGAAFRKSEEVAMELRDYVADALLGIRRR